VSHALSGHGRVAPATRKRVLRVAETLGYTANVHAQRLASGRSRTLAIQVAGFRTATSQTVLLPDAAYFMDVLNGAASAADERDYALLLAPYDVEAKRLHPLAIDGAIIVDPAEDERLTTVQPDHRIPVVTTGRPTGGQVDLPWVDNDHARLAYLMLDHLAEMGYVRPAVLATTASRSYVVDIFEGYGQWVRDNGVSPTIVELPEPPTERSAARAAKRLLTGPDRPDAVFATYDRLALGVLLEARRLGISVPDELGLASAVDSDPLRWSDPHITAVHLNAERIGREAVQLLIELVEEREPTRRQLVVPGRIVPRASTRGTPTASSAHATPS